MDEFVAKSQLSVIFLCDRLRFLSYRIRGLRDVQKVNANIRIQLDQMTQALIKVGLGSYPNAKVADWSFVHDDPQYASILSSLEELVREDSQLGQQAHEYATSLMNRFGALDGQDFGERASLQFKYVLEETVLSLIMTEIRGYNVEIYRRGMGFVDFLYSGRRGDLMRLLNKSTLDRRFVSIGSESASRTASR